MLSTCYLCGVVRSTAHTQGTRMGLTCKTHAMNQSCHDRGQLTWSPGDPKTPLIPDIPPTSSHCGQKSRGQPLNPAWMDGEGRDSRGTTSPPLERPAPKGSLQPGEGTPDSLAPSQPLLHLGASRRASRAPLLPALPSWGCLPSSRNQASWSVPGSSTS